MGMTTRKIMVVPCMVNIWLKTSGETRVESAEASWRRIRKASMPPRMKKMKAVTPYRMPMRL